MAAFLFIVSLRLKVFEVLQVLGLSVNLEPLNQFFAESEFLVLPIDSKEGEFDETALTSALVFFEVKPC